MYVNARSIVNKMNAEVKMFDPDIIGITESWTDDKEIQIEGFELFRQDRLVSKDGALR